jgi:chlorobactene glucosyltransferase
VLLFGAFSADLLLAWAICRMIGQATAYRRLEPSSVGMRDWPSVAIIVPARDEADVIARCVSGLLALDYPADRLSIWVVDDGSRDGTGAIATAVAGHDPRFGLLTGASLAEGWTGKAFACSQGAAAAGRSDFLCFMDADTVASSGLMRAALAYLFDHGLAMVSLEPFQELGSALECLVLPCGLYLVAASQDLAAINSRDSADAAANGQFILISRAAYEAVGGHEAVRSEVSEDTALARRVKRAGFGYRLLGAERLIRTRMYRGAGALWHGLSKNATVLGGGPGRTVLIAGAGCLMATAGPTLAGMSAARLSTGPDAIDGLAAVLAWGGLLAGVALHIAGTRHFRIPIVFGVLFPIGYCSVFAIALHSAWLTWRGRFEWKGRTYAASPRAASRATVGHAGRDADEA